MKRIAGNIAKAVLSTFKAAKGSTAAGNRRYDPNPRETRAEVPANNSINARGDHSLDRAYAAGSTPGEIQYC